MFRGWVGPAYALLLLALLVLTALCGAVPAAAQAHCRTRWPFGPLLREELRGLLGVGSAVCATGAVMALAVAVAGLWALPVFSLPPLLTQLSLRRYAAVRRTYRQAGLPAEEQRRIALLGGAVVRQTGVDARVAVVVERQADPCREQSLPARIVRAVNAYEEKARDVGPGGPLRALEELRLAGAGVYAPEVVESLGRVLSWEGPVLPVLPGEGLTHG